MALVGKIVTHSIGRLVGQPSSGQNYLSIPLDTTAGIRYLMQNPVGAASAAFDPETATLIKDSGISEITTTPTWDLDADGNASNSLTAYPIYTKVVGLPANPGTRKYEVWGRIADATPILNDGVFHVINWNSAGNYWLIGLTWNGTAWKLAIQEFVAFAGTDRGTDLAQTTIDWPCNYHLIAHDVGDSVVAQLYIYETDLVSDDDGVYAAYTVASRGFKTETTCTLQQYASTSTGVSIRGYKITDLI